MPSMAEHDLECTRYPTWPNLDRLNVHPCLFDLTLQFREGGRGVLGQMPVGERARLDACGIEQTDWDCPLELGEPGLHLFEFLAECASLTQRGHHGAYTGKGSRRHRCVTRRR